MKPIFWLGCYGCIFHGTGNSAQNLAKLRNFGAGVWNPPPPSLRYATVVHPADYATCSAICWCRLTNYSLHRTWRRYSMTSCLNHVTSDVHRHEATLAGTRTRWMVLYVTSNSKTAAFFRKLFHDMLITATCNVIECRVAITCDKHGLRLAVGSNCNHGHAFQCCGLSVGI
jgi:hypothetical protein